MMRKYVSLFFFALLVAAAEKNPSDVVRAAYSAANEGRYSEANTYLSSEVLKRYSAEEVKALWDEATREGTIDRIQILREIPGERTTVHFRLYYQDGTTKEDDEVLIMENGAWKITIEESELEDFV